MAKEINIYSDLNVVQKKLLPPYGNFDISTEFQNKQLNISVNTMENKFLETDKNELDFDSIQQFISEMQINNFKQNLSIETSKFWIILFFCKLFNYREVKNWYPVLNNNNSNNFKAQFQFIIKEQLFTYRCGSFELLKWAWIQYFSIFIIIRHIFRLISACLYENQMLSSIVYNNEKLKIN